eukprot:1153316-Pelagomonas_calceolata.AAC.1
MQVRTPLQVAQSVEGAAESSRAQSSTAVPTLPSSGVPPEAVQQQQQHQQRLQITGAQSAGAAAKQEQGRGEAEAALHDLQVGGHVYVCDGAFLKGGARQKLRCIFAGGGACVCVCDGAFLGTAVRHDSKARGKAQQMLCCKQQKQSQREDAA